MTVVKAVPKCLLILPRPFEESSLTMFKAYLARLDFANGFIQNKGTDYPPTRYRVRSSGPRLGFLSSPFVLLQLYLAMLKLSSMKPALCGWLDRYHWIVLPTTVAALIKSPPFVGVIPSKLSNADKKPCWFSTGRSHFALHTEAINSL